MNTEQLRYFELAYQERNFSAAARLVPCTPQGLAKAIHALEKELNVTLFENDELTGLPLPTPYAHELFEYAAVSDSNLRLLYESFDRLRGEEHKRIRLGCSLGIIGTFGSSFITDFERLHPHIEVAHWEMNDYLCDQGLIDGTYDLALEIGPFVSGVKAVELYRCPMYFWVNKDDPLATKKSLTIQDLDGKDIAIPGEGFKCYDRLREEALKANINLGRILEMSEIFQLYEFAIENQGLGFSVRHLTQLKTFTRAQEVVAIPFNGPAWYFGIQRLSTHALGTAEATFWDWCITYSHRLPSDPLGK
ncbi:MAG: LysR family transcriptional regulator [Coriobacteriales bacterium]|nr:LysR family transcriptional regulator [Coriobacteriales bacterium]